jgi:hypothetical protein
VRSDCPRVERYSEADHRTRPTIRGLASETASAYGGGIPQESTALEDARRRLAQGDLKKAVNALWRAEADGRANPEVARGVIDVAQDIAAENPRFTKDCELLVRHSLDAIERLTVRRQEDDLAHGAILLLWRCKILGGHGLDPQPGEEWDAIFRSDELVLRAPRQDPIRIPYGDMTALEIGGPGARQTGGGFFGGGVGAAGAAEGMLIASALNMLTTRTKVDTVICLQTHAAELFLHTQAVDPEQLRIRLSQVFGVLRQQAGAAAGERPGTPVGAGEDHVIDRLAKLATMLEQGLISRAEFDKLKSDLLGAAG